MAKETSLQIGQHGTPSWAFNRLREDALVQLMDDLAARQYKGLTRDKCDRVKLALAKAVNCATAIPDGSFFTKPIWKRMKAFEMTYESWNEPKGDDAYAVEHRQKELERLRKLRHKLAKTTRKNLAVIDKELDIKLVEDVYEALSNLVTSAPETFKNVARALERFSKAGT